MFCPLQDICVHINIRLSRAGEAFVLAKDISQGFYGNVECL